MDTQLCLEISLLMSTHSTFNFLNHAKNHFVQKTSGQSKITLYAYKDLCKNIFHKITFLLHFYKCSILEREQKSVMNPQAPPPTSPSPVSAPVPLTADHTPSIPATPPTAPRIITDAKPNYTYTDLITLALKVKIKVKGFKETLKSS